MINVLLVILVLGPSVYDISEGCGRVPSTPAPPTTTEASVNGTDDRNLPCNDDEKNRTNCQNGGTCFVIVINGERDPNCHCPLEYTGPRCLEINIDIIFPSLDDDHVATAGIAASVAVLVVIIIVFTGVAIVYYKRKREEREARQKDNDRNADVNGSLLPQNHIQPRNMDKHKYGNGNHISIPADENKFLNKYPVTDYKKEFEFKTTSV